jgi:hypothetical protein
MKYILPNRPNTISGDNPGGERGCGNPDSLTVMKLAQISAVKLRQSGVTPTPI